MKLIILRESILNNEINITNFRNDSECIVHYNVDMLKQAHRVPENKSTDKLFSPIEQLYKGITISEYIEYSKGHWINKSIYQNVSVLLKRHNLTEHIDTMCIILMLQRFYIISLHKRPEFQQSNYSAILNFSEKIDSSKYSPSIKLNDSKEQLSNLPPLTTKIVSEILSNHLKNTEEGKFKLAIAKINDRRRKINQLVFDNLKIDDIGRTRSSLRRNLVRELHHMLHVKIPVSKNRLALIGKLLALFGCLKPYSRNEVFNFTQNMEDDYFSDLLHQDLINKK